MSNGEAIKNVSDTALWVACYRALETERPDALFRDPFARRLAGDRGFAILDAMPDGRKTSWPLVTRTIVMDEIIMRFVARGNVDTVLNLAAGLDARPWRLELPPALRWVDVDLPDMLTYKASIIGDAKPACHYQAIAADLSDAAARREALARVGGSSVLVITEGLLVYLTAENVADLARDLHAIPSMKFWLSDLASPALLKMMERSWAPALKRGNAPMRFGPAENTGFFTPFGWREVEWYSTFHEGLRRDRIMRFGRLIYFINQLSSKRRAAFRRFSGYMVLERQD